MAEAPNTTIMSTILAGKLGEGIRERFHAVGRLQIGGDTCAGKVKPVLQRGDCLPDNTGLQPR